jgi:hypothetical protein
MQFNWIKKIVISIFLTLLIGGSSQADKGGDSSGGENGLVVELVEVQKRHLIVKCIGSDEQMVCEDCALIVEPYKLQAKLNGMKCAK